jgi:hypothetical protein
LGELVVDALFTASRGRLFACKKSSFRPLHDNHGCNLFAVMRNPNYKLVCAEYNEEAHNLKALENKVNALLVRGFKVKGGPVVAGKLVFQAVTVEMER